MMRHLVYEIWNNAGFFLWVNLGKKYTENHDPVDDLNATSMDALLTKAVFLADGAVQRGLVGFSSCSRTMPNTLTKV